MSVPLDVRFQRALRYYRPSWGKWDFDPVEHPLLGQIRDGQSELLTRSFGDGRGAFYVDFIDLPTLDACTFPDPEEPFVFIGLTRLLVDELGGLTDVVASSALVRALVGIPDTYSKVPELGAVLFALALVYVVAHEAGHYVHGHIAEGAMWFEFLGAGPDIRRRLQGHADELAADKYATLTMCQTVVGGNAGVALTRQLPPDGTYGDDQRAVLVAVAATAVFLLHLTQSLPRVDLTENEHPPLVYRHHHLMDVMRDWLTAHGKSAAAITGAGHHAIMQGVGSALPASLWSLWNDQVDLFESPAGEQYFDALHNLRD